MLSFSPRTFKAIAEVAEENDLLILSDEVYEAFCFMEEFVPMATFAPERTITFSSFSKAFCYDWLADWLHDRSFIHQSDSQVD